MWLPFVTTTCLASAFFMVVKASNCGGRSHSGSNISPLLHTVSGKDCPFTHLHTHISLSNGFEMQLEHTQVLLWCGQMPYRWFVFKLFPTHLITRVSPHTFGVYSWSLCWFSLFSSYSVELFFFWAVAGQHGVSASFQSFSFGFRSGDWLGPLQDLELLLTEPLLSCSGCVLRVFCHADIGGVWNSYFPRCKSTQK